MAIKIEDFGGASDWNDGEVLNASDLIDTIKASSTKILETYTGTGLNVVQYEEKSVEFVYNEIGHNSVRVCVNGYAIGSGYTYTDQIIKIEIKENGGSYSTVITNTITSGTTVVRGPLFDYSVVLTDGMKEHGYTIKITTSSCYGAPSGRTGNITINFIQFIAQ